MSRSSQKSSSPSSSKELRILGIDDSHFEAGDKSCLLIAVLYRNNYVESVFSTRIEVDGEDSTAKITELLQKSSCRPDAVMLQGITFGGFNVVDINKLSSEAGLPVIAVSRKEPDFGEIKAALQNVSNPEARWGKIESAGKLRKAGRIYYQSAGTDSARDIIASTTVRGNLPEPIRLAHVIASGVVLGSLHGRA